ncbi:response regulator [Halodesulfovibrio sp.]|uniref:response regulator n=1 Tax=Halodesulfovibrio sp. TaxID=1912772 RepID=UPI0025BB1D21|nr:response regulator [Halodesulfovibrio sp.]
MASISILVVDDERIVALDIKGTLETLGYQVCAVANTAETALQAAETHSPDLILMDINLKGEMDGIAIAHVFNAKYTIPVVFLTAYSDRDTFERAKSSNPYGFILKPFDARKLHSAIEIALVKHSEEARLTEARQKAELENSAKSSFFANMSHEIRNSLNGIVGMTDLALETALDKEQKEYMTTVLDSAENLLDILNDILDLSRIEARKMSLSPKRFNLEELINKTIRTHLPKAHKKKLTLTYDIPSFVPRMLKGDPTRVSQILNNLLSNAIKFTDQGGISLEISDLATLGAYSEQQHIPVPKYRMLLFSVRDTGVGLTEAEQNYIFEPYKQVLAEGKTPIRGTGLGLAICRDLVELMNGTIWVRSKPGAGSTFHFTAQFEHGELEEDITEQEIIPEFPQGLHVAIADNNIVGQKLLLELLEKKGFICHVTSNGAELLELLASESVDLVVTEIKLPFLTGIEAMNHIRSGTIPDTPTTLPVIAVTAFALKGDKERFIEAGMDGYVSKPIHASEFYREIARVLQPEEIPAQPQKEIEQTDMTQVLDVDGAMVRLDDDNELICRLYSLFVDEVAERLYGLKLFLQENAYDKAALHSQSFAAAAFNIGANSLGNALMQIYAAAAKHKPVPAEQLQALEELSIKTTEEISRNMNNLA